MSNLSYKRAEKHAGKTEGPGKSKNALARASRFRERLSCCLVRVHRHGNRRFLRGRITGHVIGVSRVARDYGSGAGGGEREFAGTVSSEGTGRCRTDFTGAGSESDAAQRLVGRHVEVEGC